MPAASLCFAVISFSILGLLAFGFRSPKCIRLTAAAASFAGGMLLAALHPLKPPPTLSVPDNTRVILQGCVVDPALISTEREKFVLELAPGARAQVSLYSRDGGFPALPYGTLVEFTGKVRTTHNFRNPGSFDAVHYLARQSIYWNVSANAAEIRILPGHCGNVIAGSIYFIRMAALDRLEHLYKDDEYSNGMMQALLIGATARLDRSWTEDYRSTGTFHALVISGSHVALLAGILLFLMRICLVPRGIAIAITVLVAWLYAGVTGWQAPVLRSAAGMSLYAIGRIFFREGRLLNILAAVAFLFLSWGPDQLFDASFQLSFLAIALIGAFVVPLLDATSSPLARGLSDLRHTSKDIRIEPRVAQFRIEMRLLADTLHLVLHIPARIALGVVAAAARLCLFLWEVAVTSFFIQLGLALPMIVYFHRLSASGISANAIVVPVLSSVVPLGFAAIAFNSHLLAGMCTHLLTISRWAVSMHARWEPDWRIPAPPLWLAALFVLALLLAALRWGRRPRALAWALASICLVTIIIHPFAPVLTPRTFELSAIDVGQGDSLLAAFPDGKLMLIDAGGIPSFGRSRKPGLNIGEDVVSPYLWSRSIRHLDVVAMTHAHEDHMGGMNAVLKNFRPGELWTGAVAESPEWKSVRETAEALHITIRQMKRSNPFTFGGAQLTVLAPLPGYEPREKPSNDDSLVMRIAFGSTSFLLTGDMEKRIEEQLFYEGALQHADVLKVGHHGSRTSSTPDLLDAVKPTFGIISAGFENSYGHPHPGTMQALADHHVVPYRTDEQGLISISSDGRHLRVTAYIRN